MPNCAGTSHVGEENVANIREDKSKEERRYERKKERIGEEIGS